MRDEILLRLIRIKRRQMQLFLIAGDCWDVPGGVLFFVVENILLLTIKRHAGSNTFLDVGVISGILMGMERLLHLHAPHHFLSTRTAETDEIGFHPTHLKRRIPTPHGRS